MHLLPKELDKLQIYTMAQIAIDKLKHNHRLNIPLTVALLTWLVLQEIPHSSVVQLMSDARQWIGKDMVMFGVVHVVDMIQVEGTFPDGTKLVTIHHPICEKGDWKKLNLKETKLPFTDSVIPGECIYDSGKITINADRQRIKLRIINTGDRPIQVGSHYPFAETNPKLKFNRFATINMHLDIPSGTSVRFEPGQDKIIQLYTFGGNLKVTGANLITPILLQNKIPDGYLHSNEPALPASDFFTMDRKSYAEMYGPTVGDKIRLGDTNLFLQIEHDHTIYGDESIFGGGKSIREGQMQTNSNVIPLNESNKRQKFPISMDLVITNVVIVDYTGIYKADIGIIGEEIGCIGKSGNPDITDCDMLITSHTEVISGEHLIITSGAVDTHVHFISIQQCNEALFSSITTMIGGGTGPATGTCATTCTPGISVKHMLQQTDHIPMNLGFTGKGNSTNLQELQKQVELGCIGLKLHEDWGTTPATIDACLQICQKMDVQCTIHTDTLNESGFVEQTIKAINNRTIHTYHTEGAGGGHAPDIITLAMHPNVIPSSTNPTRCLTKNTIDEHLDMLMVCHHLNKNMKEDLQFAESRIRKETIAAEDVMHDLGILSIISSDSQAMGRIGEVVCRTWQTAHKMKLQRGYLTPNDEKFKNDNDRIKRYIAKYTINPSIAHGVSHLVGSIEVGKIADLVLWDANSFGIKPRLILKQGKIVASQMGDANASIPTCQPIVMREQFGYYKNGISFVSKSSLENVGKYGLLKRIEAVSRCNTIGKKDMKLNDKLYKIRVNPDTFQVFVDDVLMTCEEVDTVPLCTLYQTF